MVLKVRFIQNTSKTVGITQILSPKREKYNSKNIPPPKFWENVIFFLFLIILSIYLGYDFLSNQEQLET